jgi:hypothetical protein
VKLTGTFTIYDLVIIGLFVAGCVKSYIDYRLHHKHTQQIAQLETMHGGTTELHPPEPSPGETLPPHVGKSTSQLLRGDRGE